MQAKKNKACKIHGDLLIELELFDKKLYFLISAVMKLLLCLILTKKISKDYDI